MLSTRNRGALSALIVAVLLALALTPASAASTGSEAPARAETPILSQLWEWLTSLLATDTTSSGGGTDSATTCTATDPGGRGCAIDPNGGSV